MNSVVVIEAKPADLGRSARKRAAILDAARDLFLQRGYGGTSMDDVAARAGVSKQTVYKNFADKQRLFTKVITSDVGQVDDSTQAQMAAMPDTDDVPGDLRVFARWHLTHVMQPSRLRLRRMLIGEADRFPELAQTWYASGPEQSCAEFARWFTTWGRRGPPPGRRCAPGRPGCLRRPGSPVPAGRPDPRHLDVGDAVVGTFRV